MIERTRLEHRQRAHRVRLEWGLEGATLLAQECAVVVIVDVLSFCTGQELIADGFAADVTLAGAHDTSHAAPRMRDGVLAADRPPR